ENSVLVFGKYRTRGLRECNSVNDEALTQIARGAGRVEGSEMPVMYTWQRHYDAAMVETDPRRLARLIKAAEVEIDARMEELRLKRDGTRDEKDAIAEALAWLNILRKEIHAA
ncbi:MAG TPA: hypothetical protein VGR40_10285, partial [Candidatus Binatus sp.]|nr:hypothetical protein [Candidatus Binatus sp.]